MERGPQRMAAMALAVAGGCVSGPADGEPDATTGTTSAPSGQTTGPSRTPASATLPTVGSSSEDSGETGGCPAGSLDCPCNPGGVCDGELFCDEGTCQPNALCGNGVVDDEDEACDGVPGCAADCSWQRHCVIASLRGERQGALRAVTVDRDDGIGGTLSEIDLPFARDPVQDPKISDELAACGGFIFAHSYGGQIATFAIQGDALEMRSLIDLEDNDLRGIACLSSLSVLVGATRGGSDVRLYALEIDDEGELSNSPSQLFPAPGNVNGFFVAAHPTRPIVYLSEGHSALGLGTILAAEVERGVGTLEWRVHGEINDPAFVGFGTSAVQLDGDRLLVAGVASGSPPSLAAVPLNADGTYVGTVVHGVNDGAWGGRYIAPYRLLTGDPAFIIAGAGQTMLLGRFKEGALEELTRVEDAPDDIRGLHVVFDNEMLLVVADDEIATYALDVLPIDVGDNFLASEPWNPGDTLLSSRVMPCPE